jgi:RND family efflux transporter MFP subunit
MKGLLSKRWLLPALLWSAACSHGRDTPTPAAEPEAGRVRTGEVIRRSDERDVSVPGVVAARHRASLAARIPAAVLELPFREGQAVSAGTLVVRLDDLALQSAVKAAEAGVHAATADDARARALREKDAATPREVEEAVARAAAARAALAGARESLSYAVLRSPFAGRLAARHVHVGDVVAPGAMLVEIEGAGGLEIRATLDASAAENLRIGQTVRAIVDGYAEPLGATIRSVSPAGDVATHRFELRADLPAAAGVRSGVFARLVIPGQGHEARLLIPEAAVFHRGGLAGVFVVAEGRARLRWVAVGDTAAGLTEVRAGLAEGEKVALDGRGLVDGGRVVTEAAP